jgi:hypothetical protein
MTDSICDVRKDQCPTVIREVLRHENDSTNQPHHVVVNR